MGLLLSAAALLSAAGQQPGDSCATAPYHQFDFVLGNWLVRDASGRAVGTATFAKRYGGCVIIETWLGVGHARESLGIVGFRAGSQSWHRTFLDSTGVVQAFDGRRDGRAMVMTGRDYPADGPRLHRVTWTARDDGSVEERWQTSVDAGRSWQEKSRVVFFRIAE
jgi:hypothetical protein